MNVAALFDRQAERSPDALAVRWARGSLDYGTLRALSQRFAAVLASRRIRAGDRVGLLLPNHPAFAVALLGCLRHGATAVVLSPAWTPADAAQALALGDVCLLVTTEALAAAIGAAPEHTLTVGEDASSGAFGHALAHASPGQDLPAVARAPEDPATVLFSSGTTGNPKGVVLTHGNLLFNAQSKIRYCGIAPADRLAMVVPIAHCFGQNVVLLGALLAGAAVELYERFDPELVARGIHDGTVTMLLAAPTAFARLLSLGDEAALRKLRYALSAAAPLGEGLAADWHRASGRALAQGYGLTECSPFAVYDAAASDRGRGVGRAIDGVTVRIAGAEREGWAAAGESGEIAIRGPNVMAGYWRQPAATARTLRDGWLYTGDVGFLDDAGSVHLIDRVDDVINVAGFKAWPSDVERALLRHPAVHEAAAYGVADARRGSSVAAAVVLRQGARATPDDLMRHAAGSLAGYQRPTMVQILPALPRSPSGKVLRRALAATSPG